VTPACRRDGGQAEDLVSLGGDGEAKALSVIKCIASLILVGRDSHRRGAHSRGRISVVVSNRRWEHTTAQRHAHAHNSLPRVVHLMSSPGSQLFGRIFLIHKTAGLLKASLVLETLQEAHIRSISRYHATTTSFPSSRLCGTKDATLYFWPFYSCWHSSIPRFCGSWPMEPLCRRGRARIRDRSGSYTSPDPQVSRARGQRQQQSLG